MSCELKFKVQLMSALPHSPTTPSSRFAEVTNLNQDLTLFGHRDSTLLDLRHPLSPALRDAVERVILNAQLLLTLTSNHTAI